MSKRLVKNPTAHYIFLYESLNRGDLPNRLLYTAKKEGSVFIRYFIKWEGMLFQKVDTCNTTDNGHLHIFTQIIEDDHVMKL